MAQNSKDFINSLCTVLNALSNTGGITELSYTPGESHTGNGELPKNNLHIKAKKRVLVEIDLTVGSDETVLLTYDPTYARTAKGRQLTSKDMKRIVYGKNSISEILNDLAAL